MQINTKKSVCIRIGARYNTECARLSLAEGGLLQWVSQCRYLGVYVLTRWVPRNPMGETWELYLPGHATCEVLLLDMLWA